MTQGSDYSSDTFAEFYDHFDVYTHRGDVDFFVSEAVAAGGPVLELGCGTGRVLVPCARADAPMWGLDFSETMLSRCRLKLASEPQEVRQRVVLQQGDMRNFCFDVPFQLVTIPFRPFQHLTKVEEQLACLSSIHRALADGGRLILDVFNPSLKLLVDDSRFEEQFGGEPFTLPDGRVVQRMERVSSRDYLRQVVNAELISYVTHPDGRRERFVQALQMRYLFRYEIEHLLARCGFEVEAAYGDYNRTPLEAGPGQELVYVARKVGRG
ncbi:MAG TPA: class I SAM-dependent methyltransferase [Planctomycetaceae bacterium]|jgi:SAM-dependent methyltransferase|nr:class I SAM-dependent methyltransferase [Planctomycetaceae bacterium]